MDEVWEEPNRPQYLRRPIRSYSDNLEEEKRERIKDWMAVALVTFAFCVDLSEFVITWLGFVKIGGILTMVVSAIAQFIFWLWYLLLGVPAISNPKQFATRLGTFLVEIIPFFDALPLLSWGWTFGTIATIIITRSEDKGGIISKAASAAEGNLKNVK